MPNEVLKDGNGNPITLNVLTAGTAGTPSADVGSIQGISGGVAVGVSGTFWQATQPVSGTVAATESGTWNVGLNAGAQVQLTDGTNVITNETAGADAKSNTLNRVPGSAAGYAYNGTTWDRIRSGLTAVQTVTTGLQNNIAMGVYNASPLTLANTNLSPIQFDVNGYLKVNMSAGFVQVSDGTNPIATDVSGSDAKSNTSNRFPTVDQMYGYNGATWDRLRCGVASNQATTGVTQVTPAIQNPSSNFDSAKGGQVTVQTSPNGFNNTIPMTVYNSSAPAPASGNTLPLQSDSAGNLRVNTGVVGFTFTHSVTAMVTNTSTQVLASNANRKYLILQNNDATDGYWIAFGVTATKAAPSFFIGAKTLTNTEPQTFILAGPVCTQAVNAIYNQAGTPSTLSVLEGA